MNSPKKIKITKIKITKINNNENDNNGNENIEPTDGDTSSPQDTGQPSQFFIVQFHTDRCESIFIFLWKRHYAI